LAFVSAANVRAQGTSFTYQGVLNQNGAPYSGSAEIQFTLWNAASSGSAVATNNPASLIVAVTNGLFTASLDFGTAFPGADRWLQMDVRTVIGPFTTLSPRQKLTPAPYAITAGGVVSGGIPAGTYNNAVTFNNAANSFTGAFTGNGAGLSNVNVSTLNGLTSASFWKTNGNLEANPTNGAFIGTLDNLPLEFRVNGQRVLRLEPNTASPNVIGGVAGNSVSNGVAGATIGGGGGNLFLANRVGANGGTVGGGIANFADGLASTIAGGYFNRAQGQVSAVGGGESNESRGTNSTIGGGFANRATGIYATVPGGRNNTATNFAFAAGYRAQANHVGSFVWADSVDADFNSTGTNQFRVRAGGGMEIVGGPNQPAFRYSAARSGNLNAPVGLAENFSAATNCAPALRVVNYSGNSPEGALSVSTAGTGLIARFGNSSAFVAELSTNGTFSAVTFNPTSDRNAKENFSSVNVHEILEKVASLPISRWNFKINGGSEHLGPVAQDFHAAFGLNGDDDRHIATVDADGVALAAIQGLNQKLEAELAEKNSRISDLEQRLERLENLISKSAKVR